MKKVIAAVVMCLALGFVPLMAQEKKDTPPEFDNGCCLIDTEAPILS